MINNEVTVNKGIVHAEHVQKGKLHFPFGAEISAYPIVRSQSMIMSIPDGFTPPVRPWKPVIPV